MPQEVSLQFIYAVIGELTVAHAMQNAAAAQRIAALEAEIAKLKEPKGKKRGPA